MTNGTLVVAGALAQKPRHGGHAWVLLQYLLGFKRLGWDVLFLDRLPPNVEDPPDIFLNIMRRFGLDEHFALLRDDSFETLGLTRDAILDRVRYSPALLNINGFLKDPEILGCATRRVFLDIDPGFPQMWTALGLYDAFKDHNAFVTIGMNIAQPTCAIPICDRDWITTLQPIVLEYWPLTPPGSKRFTSVATWRGSNGPVEYAGRTYGLRVHEFRKFVSLPCVTGQQFELALDIHPSEVSDIDLLRRGGWTLVDPRDAAQDPWAYRSFIQRSSAEFMVAKQMYVSTRSGWFSDRSLCYLASGKPVLAQDTGLRDVLPTGKGLVTFRTLDEARRGVEEITRDYDAHARSARELAEEHFDSDVVLNGLLSKLGIQ